MINVSDYPLLVFVISLVVLSLSVPIGANFLRRLLKWEEDKREDFGIILGATLTLLALIVGFSCRSRSFSSRTSTARAAALFTCSRKIC